MNKYDIYIKYKGYMGTFEGETPQDAFKKLYPIVELSPTKDTNTATVCIELVGGKKKSV